MPQLLMQRPDLLLMQRPDLMERPGAILVVISIFLVFFTLVVLLKHR